MNCLQRSRAWAGALLACLVLISCHVGLQALAADTGATLFHQGDQALSWDHDELVSLRKVHADLSNPKDFLYADSVGSYFGFQPVEALHMPVPVNLLFVGFAADGNMHVNISNDQLQEWFGHLDHVLPHARVELADLSCAEDGQCAGQVHGHYTASNQEPVPSYVHLNFSCNLVVTRRVSVTRMFERAIHAFSRPVDPEIEMGAQQVDAGRMEAFVHTFMQFLGIQDRGYTLVVLNPTWSADEPVYGYRMGMSQPEIDSLLLSTDKVKQLLAHHVAPEPLLPAAPLQSSGWWSKPARESTIKFGMQDFTFMCDPWLTAMDKYLTQVEDHRKALLKAVGQVKGAAAIGHAVMLIMRGDAPISSILREELISQDPYTSVYSKFRTMHPAEDCLVGNWVSHHRWVLVDLTAGSFDWGPSLGGEGVMHRHSLPDVVDHFTPLHHMKHKALEKGMTSDERQLGAQMDSKVATTKAERANKAYQAFQYEMQLKKRHANAPGSPDSPQGQQGVESEEEIEDQQRRWKTRYQETVLKAELDVYTEYSAKYCDQVTNPPPLCHKMKEASLVARNMLAKLAGSQASSVDVWRDVRWNVFSAELDLDPDDFEIQDAAARARDLFLSELNGVLSRALRHVIAPPTATWAHAGGYLHDTATPFTPHVSFQVYVIREQVHANVEVVPDTRPFDVEALKQQVSRLALPNQHFTFNTHTVQLEDDAVLSTAVAAAQRTSAQDILSDEDTVHEAERVYLDTRVLGHVLRQRFGSALRLGRAGGDAAASPFAARRKAQLRSLDPKAKQATLVLEDRNYHEVPVFIFELHREYAVLLDEHYNAKALEDMIVVVQNAARDDEHPTGMMCGGALVARPLSALRDALSATLTHLGGVLPPHLGYNPQRHRVMHDWLWSVGNHPHSFTSAGTQYSEIQRDAVARSYLLDAIDSSIDAVNAGIRTLRRVNPTPAVHAHLKKHKHELTELVSLWPALLAHWRSVMEAAWHLDWSITRELDSIQQDSLRFLHLAQQLASMPLGSHCMGTVTSKNGHLVFPMLVMSVATSVAALIWMLWPAVFGKARSSSKHYGIKF